MSINQYEESSREMQNKQNNNCKDFLGKITSRKQVSPIVLNWDCENKIYDVKIINELKNYLKNSPMILFPVSMDPELEIMKQFLEKVNFDFSAFLSLRGLVKIQTGIIITDPHKDKNVVEKADILFNSLKNSKNDNRKKIHNEIVNFIISNKIVPGRFLHILKASGKLNNIDKVSLEILEEIDKEIKKEKVSSLTRSREFERNLYEYLTLSNVEFITEDDIRSMCSGFKEKKINDEDDNYEKIVMEEIATPDIVFPSTIGIRISGIVYYINWMDAKNTFGDNVPFLRKSLTKQSSKYNRIYGPGCFVFHYGMSSTLKIPGTLLLTFTC